jgi:hypothetical protein
LFFFFSIRGGLGNKVGVENKHSCPSGRVKLSIAG